MLKSGSELISVSQAASMLSLDVRTVHRKIQRGELPAQKMPGRTAAYILRRADVEALLASAGAERNAS
jgi:excisionase family DNA binding protein